MAINHFTTIHVCPMILFLVNILLLSLMSQVFPSHVINSVKLQNSFLSTANCSILLHAILAPAAHVEALPPKDEVSKIRTDEDADDKVPVVIHRQQHYKISHSKCAHV